MSSDHSGDGKDDAKDVSVAKTAGFVVFSGIAMSILKAFNPFNNKNHQITEPPTLQQQQQQPPIVKKPTTTSCCVEQNEPNLLIPRTVDIVRGDTLWGLSKQYGVSIEAIKEANGLTGDKIYAGKKLIIP